jgi:hypothetical protein
MRMIQKTGVRHPRVRPRGCRIGSMRIGEACANVRSGWLHSVRRCGAVVVCGEALDVSHRLGRVLAPH